MTDFLRKIFYFLPLTGRQKTAVKGFLFKNAAFLFRPYPMYRRWLDLYPPPENKRRPLYLSTPYFGDSIRLPSSERPLVSIIIPVRNQWAFTLCCLSTIAFHRSAYPYEVLIVDDGSSDETRIKSSQIHGVRLIALEKRSGFVKACNEGAKQAKGEHLLFLNNDTEVTAGWLDELVKTFYSFPNAGMVGSKLLFADGSLQNAGASVYPDGSIKSQGRNENPEKPEFSYLREVDSLSGASLMIPAELFRRLGGFDHRYAPAYREDTDLSLQVRKAGWKVFFQPASKVIHYESVTASSDEQTDIRKYQHINQKKFKKKWARELSAMSLSESKKPRVLVIDMEEHDLDDVPQESLDLFHYMQLIQSLGYQVTFATEDLAYSRPENLQRLQRMGIECLYRPFTHSISDHLEKQGQRYHSVFLCRPEVARIHFEKVKNHCPEAHIFEDARDFAGVRLPEIV